MAKCAPEPSSPVTKVWKPELYKIQLEAPTPKAVMRKHDIDDAPEQYGYEYHGEMDHKESEEILSDTQDGTYLVRQSPGAEDFFTLSVRFNRRTKHYKIFYRPNYGHYLKEDFKRFETIHDLVADGLVNFYMQIHAAPIIQEMLAQTKNSYHQSPYMTLNRRKLRALSNDLRRTIHANNLAQQVVAQPSPTVAPDEVDVLPVVYEKHHAFKIHSFKGLNWCEFCANFLWGFTAQGVKCEDCGFIAHNKCSELVPPKCVPDLKRLRGVFGTDLTTLVAAHHCTVPFVIRRCVEEVEARGMLQEGIYRVSGFADEVEALKLALDKDGDKTDMSEAAYSNINVIAGTLKLYLRLLPVPLITFQAYPAFMAATKSRNSRDQIQNVKEALKHLPPAHLNCLKVMIEHLNRVASHQNINKMTEYNLATVFAPTLIATPHHLTDLSQEIFMLSFLISNCNRIFA
ncbi:beta-chimaerin isoform X2 [Lutzomyia longipalpis]|uniref:beta-chimaerin isoform X2 n=1 Tax=Lutzomyia longipalpis TaxID=7200 RepID=UPI0024840082|nr:beta-chimaerin isoform X2 [Lutzomyia longipalpis]